MQGAQVRSLVREVRSCLAFSSPQPKQNPIEQVLGKEIASSLQDLNPRYTGRIMTQILRLEGSPQIQVDVQRVNACSYIFQNSDHLSHAGHRIR